MRCLNPKKIFNKLSLTAIKTSNEKFSILIPYRDNAYQNRSEQLKTLIPYLEEKLSKHTNDFKIIVIEQSNDDKKFNRGALLNIGHLIAKEFNSKYIIFHDVDLLPDDDILKYYLTYPESPIHIGNKITKYSYDLFIGAVFSVSINDNKKINGFSNCFWGWGGEDDAYLNRLVANKILVDKAVDGSFNEILHKKDWRNVMPKDARKKLAQKNFYNWKYDGISSIKHIVIDRKYLTKSGRSIKYTVKLDPNCQNSL